MAGAYTFLITGEYSKETECFEFNKMAVSQQTITGTTGKSIVYVLILLHEKFLQFDWLRAVVCQLNLKYLHVKITKFLRVVL